MLRLDSLQRPTSNRSSTQLLGELEMSLPFVTAPSKRVRLPSALSAAGVHPTISEYAKTHGVSFRYMRFPCRATSHCRFL